MVPSLKQSNHPNLSMKLNTSYWREIGDSNPMALVVRMTVLLLPCSPGYSFSIRIEELCVSDGFYHGDPLRAVPRSTFRKLFYDYSTFMMGFCYSGCSFIIYGLLWIRIMSSVFCMDCVAL